MKFNPFVMFLIGAAMGAANVIPGVSGGTIALISGIYERLLKAVKSINPKLLPLALSGRVKDTWVQIDGTFLALIGIGVVVSILTLARVFEFLLQNFPTPTYGFFFGLIAVSVWSVGRDVRKWDIIKFACLVLGTGTAIFLALAAPAQENASFLYLVFCGAIAMGCMMLPGLSGSFVLILMGNYLLVISAINSFNFEVLIPVAIGSGVGLIFFARLLSWLFEKGRDYALSLMTGFVLGSLLVIWPWKTALTKTQTKGEVTKTVTTGYEMDLPMMDTVGIITLLTIVAGAALMIIVDTKSTRETN